MNPMTVSSQELKHWDRNHVWHAFTQMQTYEPFIVSHAEGCELIDIDGNRYLDAESSLWCNVHGHRHPRLDQALVEQLSRVAHVTLLGMSSDTTVKLAHELAQVAPGNLEHVFFSSDGACANEVAIKLAYQYWQHVTPGCHRSKFLCFDDAYHGDTLGTISVGGVDRFNAVFGPLLFETVRCPIPNAFRCPNGREAACDFYLENVREQLVQQGDQLAAVIVEPLVQCAAGMVTHPPGFLRGLADLCQEFDVLLIADEIAVGFGRTGTLFACEQENVVPDFLCLGKGLTAGYLPLSATLTHRRIWDAFLGPAESSRQFCHGHTYGGNPLAAAVALENLRLFADEPVLAHAQAMSQRLARGLQRFSDHPHVGDIRQCGLIVGIELVADRETGRPFPPDHRLGQRVCQEATKRGVWLRPLQDVIVIMPPLAVSEDQVDRIVETLDVALSATEFPG